MRSSGKIGRWRKREKMWAVRWFGGGRSRGEREADFIWSSLNEETSESQWGRKHNKYTLSVSSGSSYQHLQNRVVRKFFRRHWILFKFTFKKKENIACVSTYKCWSFFFPATVGYTSGATSKIVGACPVYLLSLHLFDPCCPVPVGCIGEWTIDPWLISAPL